MKLSVFLGCLLSINAYAMGVGGHAGGGGHSAGHASAHTSAGHAAVAEGHVATGAHVAEAAPHVPTRTVSTPSTFFPHWVPFFGHTTREVPCDPKTEQNCK